jgi:hypothetical protein
MRTHARYRIIGYVIAAATFLVAAPPSARAVCTGDCNNDGTVSVNELITGVNVALGRMPMTACTAFDSGGDAKVSVAELISGVRAALEGCGINLQAKTFRSIQEVFTNSCALSSCHSTIARQGGLVLDSEEVAWDSLVDHESTHPDAQAAGLLRVASGDPENSFLIRKLRGMGPGDRMPQVGQALSEETIQIIEDWIARGAHTTTEECPVLGEEGGGAHGDHVRTVCDDTPIEPGDFVWKPEQPLAVPDPSDGIQLYVPPRPVQPGQEWEECVAFRVDWAKVSSDLGLTGGAAPTIKWQEYRMHEGSHHLLVYMYFGNNPDWEWPEGPFNCSAGNCRDAGICGAEGTCTSGKLGKSCAVNEDCDECPPDGRTILPVGGTQVAGTRYTVTYPAGVGIPVLGQNPVIIANLHYTNPFQPAQAIYGEGWLNFHFHKPGEFKQLLDGVFAIGYRDLFVEPYQERSMSMMWHPNGIISGSTDAKIFQLFGHMHKRATLFQIDLVSGGACSQSGNLCGRDDDCACRPWERNCETGQTCVLAADHEDTTIYRTPSWDNAPVVDYPAPYLRVNKDQGLRWTCTHVNGVEGDPTRPPKKCHEGCRACGWQAETRTCVFDRGIYHGVDSEARVYQEGDPMPLVFGELADDDMCNMFGYFLPAR